MAAGAGIVAFEASHSIEPQQTTNVSQTRVNWPSETFDEPRFDTAGETNLAQTSGELEVEPVGALSGKCGWDEGEQPQHDHPYRDSNLRAHTHGVTRPES